MTTLSDLVRLRKAYREAEVARAKAIGDEWRRRVRMETAAQIAYRNACDEYLDAIAEEMAK